MGGRALTPSPLAGEGRGEGMSGKGDRPVALTTPPDLPLQRGGRRWLCRSGSQITEGSRPAEAVGTLSPLKWLGVSGGSGAMALAAFMVCLGFGTETISFSQVAALLAQGPFAEGAMQNAPHYIILWQVRVPRVLLAFMVGGSLAAVGASLQALLRNPLADPYVIGISSGAALGAAVAILFGIGLSILGLSVLPFYAFLGALLALLIVYRIALSYGSFSMHTLLLGGVVLNAIFSALILFLTSLADPYKASGMYAWLMGSLTGPDFQTVLVLAVYLLLGVAVLVSQASALNLLTLGEEAARSLGVEVERVKRVIFAASALLTGSVVAFSGLIGFVGLIVPHAIRLVFGADHRLLLIASGMVGGTFLMVADTLARTLLSPTEIPVGVVTALAGGPVFLYLLVQQRRRIVS